MSLKNKFISLVPKKYELPIRYHFKRINGTLEKELFILQNLIGKGEVVVDIGANYGYYSYALSKISKRVECFEPNPGCAEVIKSYNANNIIVHNEGLSSKGAYLQLHVPIINGVVMTQLASFSDYSGEQQVYTVPVRALDEYQFTNVSFIKIDVEGHELDVLQGAEETILREKPTLLVEIEQRHLPSPIHEVFNKVLSYGYAGSFLYKGDLMPLQEFSYELHQKQHLTNVMSHNYVNDFIFHAI